MIYEHNGSMKSRFCKDGVAKIIGNSQSVKFNLDKFYEEVDCSFIENVDNILRFNTKDELDSYCLKNNIEYEEAFFNGSNFYPIKKETFIYTRGYNHIEKKPCHFLSFSIPIINRRLGYRVNEKDFGSLVERCSDSKCLICGHDDRYCDKVFLFSGLENDNCRTECVCAECFGKMKMNALTSTYHCENDDIVKIIQLKEQNERLKNE